MEASEKSARIRRKKPSLGPGVYVFKRRKQFLYVGCTANLNDRPNKRGRGQSNRFAAILESTSMRLIPCESIEKAKQKEEELIRTFHPKYNLRNPRAEADLERTTRLIRENW